MAGSPTSRPTPRADPTDRPALPVIDPGLPTAGRALQRVVVQARPGLLDAARRAVGSAGGAVGAPLPLIDGFAATVPAARLAVLGRSPAVRAVTADRLGRFHSAPAPGPAGADPPATASEFVASTGAAPVWAAGDLGQGVGVALIDTGVSPVDDLAGRVVWGPDLSGEATPLDTYGHGTVMAGLIAGNGADSSANPGGGWTGEAPAATVVAVKVAGASGAVDVSTILAAMGWVSAAAHQLHIRVLNLSVGFPSTQDPRLDPLNYAVERLWHEGIVVVVSAGNSGPGPSTITKPGDDPDALTVGAYDDRAGYVPDWSSRGPTELGLAKPDLVAPGRSITATRSPGSTVEQQNPQALVAPDYILASGTSEATAVTSGAVALLLAARPHLTPDQVKALVVSGARALPGYDAESAGAGVLDVDAAVAGPVGDALSQGFQGSGRGSIEATRGFLHVATTCDGTPTVIQGEEDALCRPWTGGTWTGGTWTGGTWTGGTWTGGTWTGGTWTGGTWTGGTWTGGTWTGGTWTGAAFGDLMTAFWGSRPPPGQYVDGEPFTPADGTQAPGVP